MDLSKFPNDPPRFVALPTSGRGRVILVSSPLDKSPTAVQVATVPSNVDVVGLVAALNHCAWTGEDGQLALLLVTLPSDAAQSCREALQGVRELTGVVVSDGFPVSVVREVWAPLSESYLEDLAEASITLGCQVLLTNELDDDMKVMLRATVLSSDQELLTVQDSSWWPLPDGSSVTERLVSTTDFATLLADPRWGTNHARAFWAWIDDGDDESTATWVVEFFDAALEPDRNFRTFVAGEPAEDEDEYGALTPRNRFMLWLALSEIAADLDNAVATQPWDPRNCGTVTDMPRITHGQSVEWWSKMSVAASELEEAARKGDIDRLVPRTVAEEALIALATRSDWVDVANDRMQDEGLESAYDALPEWEMDGEFPEVLPDLTGDADVEMLWTPSNDGIEDPDDQANALLGMGDYRPAVWHELFDRAR